MPHHARFVQLYSRLGYGCSVWPKKQVHTKCPRHFEGWNGSFFTLVSSTTTFYISGKLH
jgi:hypothetical protein